MGPAGSGKTTVGKLLAAQLSWEFADGDDFHPPANIEKMSRGIPLTDEDRLPWLRSIREAILQWQAQEPDVLLHQSLALGLEQALHLDRLRDHRGDHPEELAGPFVVAFRLEAQLSRLAGNPSQREERQIGLFEGLL